eukprot:TRINITY_DN23960_c0_g2_i1.p1 TRINITY_DN23960_c0_g2~~TRINITY_DN23960_c0_g2_i1.p1  ORF type:complete len:376 (+),score=68.50 TRINITY_DN23960_c0_g2_i1:86-1213(+)
MQRAPLFTELMTRVGVGDPIAVELIPTERALDGYTGEFHWITDVDDLRFDAFRNLKDRAARGASAGADDIIAEGPESIRLLLASDFTVERLLVKPTLFCTFRPSLEARAARRSETPVPVFLCPAALVEQVTGVPATHAGAALALARRPEQGHLEVQSAVESTAAATATVAALVPNATNPAAHLRILALNSLDEEAVGSLFRVASAFGVHAVVLAPNCGDPFSRRAVRVSMGHTFRIPVLRGELVRLIGMMRSLGAVAIAAAGSEEIIEEEQEENGSTFEPTQGRNSEGVRCLDELGVVSKRWICAIGPERGGVTQEVRDACNVTVAVRTSLPHCPLGVGVAVAILLNGIVEREERTAATTVDGREGDICDGGVIE